MGVDHRCPHVIVSEQFLHSADVVAERCEVAPVGEAWLASATEPDPVPLHSADHSHPQYAGSYLAAVVLYGTIYRPEQMKVPFHGSLDGTTAERLQKVAARVLESNGKPQGERPR